ncbi:hypothetical protein [Paenibacillus senegalensis]|uniref:hypothetical protein n=1 Tax=Paenibacillus senegalensis TaxID=1465766 RepID=UPI000289B0FB|nr:hypothetical protein [Paenibacillus senegalensis]
MESKQASCFYATVGEMIGDHSLTTDQIIATAGYYAPGDGGASLYMIREGRLPEDGGSILTLANGKQAHLLPVDRIHYKQFGAVGDGTNDDGVQIKAAHTFANSQSLPVVCPSGEYWIKQTYEIPIETDVSWGQTIFHLDERFNTLEAPRFRVISKHKPVEIELDEAQKAELLASLRPGTTLLPMLAEYKNCLVFVVDEKDRIGVRAGYDGSISWSKEEFFYVEEQGRLIGDLAWTFSDYTKLVAYPCDESYLTVDGGTFYLSGDIPGDTYEGYFYNGFTISRSRTTIRNQWVGLEKGRKDIARNPRHGFYQFERVYDVGLENIRLLPWVHTRPGQDRNTFQGTYGIGGRRALHATLRNVTAEGSWEDWGVIGTNLFKNFTIENCRLNRIDVHFHCWNISIRNSEIGYRGITLCGGGELVIDNTKRYGDTFISFRPDYGARWDGPILIRDCTLMAEGKQPEAVVLDFQPADHDYRYPVGFGRTIQVEGFTFRYSGKLGDEEQTARLMQLPAFSMISSTGERFFFPHLLDFRNIQVVGRQRGIRLFNIFAPSGFHTGKPGGFTGDRLAANCYMRFENIPGEKVEPQYPLSAAHVNFGIDGIQAAKHEDEFSLYPKMEFVNVGDFFGRFKGVAADISFKSSVIRGVDAASAEGPLRGRIHFEQCEFAADVHDDGRPLTFLDSELGTYFRDCTIHVPLVNGTPRPDLLDRYDFIEVNSRLRYYHSNTKLSRALHDYFNQSGQPVLPEFTSMLRSHHGEDSEWMARRQGTTEQRPPASAFLSVPGFQYYDTELERIVAWNGSRWV